MKNAIRKTAAATVLALAASVSSAATISFQPALQSVLLGNQASVNLVVSGLGTANDGVFLSAFDVDVLFDNSRLTYIGKSNVSSFFDVFVDSDLGGGTIDIFGASTLLSDAQLNAQQMGDSLLLATLTFGTTATGLASVGIDADDPNLALWGALNRPAPDGTAQNLPIFGLSGALIDISRPGGPNIPEPGSLALLALGLIGAASVRRRR